MCDICDNQYDDYIAVCTHGQQRRKWIFTVRTARLSQRGIAIVRAQI